MPSECDDCGHRIAACICRDTPDLLPEVWLMAPGQAHALAQGTLAAADKAEAGG